MQIKLLLILFGIVLLPSCSFITFPTIPPSPTPIIIIQLSQTEKPSTPKCNIDSLSDITQLHHDVDREPYKKNNDGLGYTLALEHANNQYKTLIERIYHQYLQCMGGAS